MCKKKLAPTPCSLALSSISQYILHGMEFSASNSRVKTLKSDRFHHANAMAGTTLRGGHVQQGACWMSVSVFSFFFFHFLLSLFLLHLLLFSLSSFFLFFFFFCFASSFPFSFSFFLLDTDMASSQIDRIPKAVCFSSKPIKWLDLPWFCTRFSKISDDWPQSRNWRWQRSCLGVCFCLVLN